MKTMYKIAFTGHRPQKLANPVQTKSKVYQYLASEKATNNHLLVVSGGALGVDQYAAEAAVKLHIPLVLVLPFPPVVMCAKWPLHARAHLQELIHAAVKTFFVQHVFSFAGYQLRNVQLVDHCDKLCAIWDGSSGGTANCVHYAKTKGCKIDFILP